MYKKIFFILFSLISGLCYAAISVESRLYFDCNETNSTLTIELKNIGDELADAVELIPMKGSTLGNAVFNGILRPGVPVQVLHELSLEQRAELVAEYSCCSYPFLLRYKDRFGNEYSSCVRASCVNTHLTQANNEEVEFVVASACVQENASTSSLAIVVMYDYEKAINLGANELYVSYFLPDGITPLNSNDEQSFVFPLKENGLSEINIKLQTQINNICGYIPYTVVAQLFNEDGEPFSIPIGTTDQIYIDSPLDFSVFPQLPNIKLFIAAAIVFILVFFVKLLKPTLIKSIPIRVVASVEWLLVAGITIYFASILQLPLALEGNTCVGGDLPAHHYLVSHIQETGRPISWADGWWCGFPMFQYYFPLPYACLALFSSIFSHNVVFNVGVCLGILLLPLSVYLSARIARLPRPLPIVATCFVIPLVLDNTHNMWGVNAYSTLAGMVANSWSFCLFFPALANICRDIQDNKFRLCTPILIAAVALSHFFTSIVLALIVGIFWLLVLHYSIRNKTTHYRIPLIEGVIAILLVSWWLLPLVVTGEWSIAFGSQWEISFFKQLPNIVTYSFLPLLVMAFCYGICSKEFPNKEIRSWFFIFISLFVVALGLFYYGRSIGEVFVNCRLWPFIVFSLLFIMAGFFAYAFRDLPLCGTLFAAILCFTFAWNDKKDDDNEIWSYCNLAPSWAEYNFSGYENTPSGQSAQELIDYLCSVEPCGRIAYDLHPFNESLGSTRFFEALPALTGHHIIEGGIVNSAIGSLTAYVVQGEMSEHTAGAPLLVNPQKFNPTNGLAHLEILGVRRFIAHSNSTIEALRDSPMWKEELVIGEGKWILFKHISESDGLVRKWNNPINCYVSDNFQKDTLEWLYVGAAVLEPFCFVDPEAVASAKYVPQSVPEPYSRLNELKNEPAPTGAWISEVSEDIPYTIIKDGGRYEIHFKATELEKPYIVAMSYFPDWEVKGALGPYYVTPGFLVVYPTQEDVVLYYDDGLLNIIGYSLSIIGLCFGFFVQILFWKNLDA